MNFASIAFIDPFDLAASLRTRWGLFKKRDDGLMVLPVRGTRANANDPDDEAAFVYYKRATWAELTNLLRRAQRLGDGLEFGRIWLEMLPSGYRGRWEFEDTAYDARWSRTYLAVRWNPQATLFSGAEAQVLTPGWITLVNHRAPRSALNLGEWNAVALVVDSRKKEAQP